MKQEEEIRRRTCRVEQFLSVLAFDRRPNDDISLLIQQLCLTKHRFLLLSFVDRFLPEILYIEIRRHAFGDAIIVVKRVWLGFWVV